MISLGTLSALWAGGPAAAQDGVPISPRITADAVLGRAAQAVPAAREGCAKQAGGALARCFARALENAGAPPAAVAFAQGLNQPGYIQAFRPLGPVDALQVVFPFRANENTAIWLVNGEPSPIDIDGPTSTPAALLAGNAVYHGIAADFPQVTLWPGPRDIKDHLDAEPHADGGTRIVLPYRLRNQCHACAILGTAWFGFDFDANGHLAAATLVGVTRAADSRGATANEKQVIEVRAGHEFTVVLPSNITTGYSWGLIAPLDLSNLRLVAHAYRHPNSDRLGAPGDEIWTFGALAAGQMDIVLGYRRPWENPATPVQTRRFAIIIRPN